MADLPCEAIAKENQSNEIDTINRLNILEKEALSLVYDACHRAKVQVSKHYDKKISIFQGGLVKIVEGGSNHLHSDRYMLDGSKWDDGTGREDEYQFSAILYLSSQGEDFEGGNIIFPQHQLTVTPEPGMLVFFPGDLEHIHRVDKITSGNRHAIVMFMGY